MRDLIPTMILVIAGIFALDIGEATHAAIGWMAFFLISGGLFALFEKARK